MCPSAFILGLVLFVILAAFRIYGYLGSENFQGQTLMIGFMLMWLVPVFFLTSYGREQIGFGQRRSIKWIFLALICGAALASACHYLGLALYDKGEQNWFVSVAFTYQSDERLALLERNVAFALFTLPAVVASPVGEELFFRGFLEQSKRNHWSPFAGSCLSAALFASIHLLHHGIYRNFSGEIEILPTSGAIWFALMFGTSLVFSYLRQYGRSIWTAVFAHASFNLTMNTYIFYSLLVTHPQIAPLP